MGAPDDLIALDQIRKRCQGEVQGLHVNFMVLRREDEQDMARARKQLEKVMRCVPLKRPDKTIRGTVPSV